MEHKGTVFIETKRLTLRQFRTEDAAAAFRNWTSDSEVTKYLCWPAHPNIETTREIIQTWVDGYADPRVYQWAVVLMENGDEPIGTISVVRQDEDLGIMHIGYCIGRGWWNRGVTSEALAGIIPFLFRQVGANRVESRHDPMNPHSGRVMLKCGLRYEGTLRQADRNNRGIVDAAMYGLLARDYIATPAGALILRPPTLADEALVLAYVRDFLAGGESTDGSAGAQKVSDSDSYVQWLAAVQANSREETVAPGLVPATTLLAVDEAGGLVGFLDIRHRLNDHLLAVGGHIGYSVHPSRRRQGNAKRLLAWGLGYCRDILGLDRVLVTCDRGNEGSARAILANGGMLEDERPQPGGGAIQRYWITL